MSVDVYPDLSQIPKRPFLVTLKRDRLSVLIVFFISREDPEDHTMDPCFDEEAATVEAARMQIELLLAEEEITREDAIRLTRLLDEIRLPEEPESPLALSPLTVHFVRSMGGDLEDFLAEVVEEDDSRTSVDGTLGIAEIVMHLWSDTENDEDTIVIHDEPQTTGAEVIDLDGGVASAAWRTDKEAATA